VGDEVLRGVAEVVEVGGRTGSSQRKMNLASVSALGLLAVDDGLETRHCIGVKVGDSGVTPVAWAWGPGWRRRRKEGRAEAGSRASSRTTGQSGK
jgi:hypothetical protein